MSSNSQLSHPSPTPSSASSSSNSLSLHSDGIPGQQLHRPQRPRFGQTSPNQVRKLLALSDGSVIVPHNSQTTGVNNSNNQSGHHYHHQQYSHNIRSSNSSLNSSLSSSTSYYNSIYGCHPSHHPYTILNNNTVGGYANGNISNSNNYHSGGSHPKISYGHSQVPQSYSNSNCCPMSSCCGAPQSGALFPNQSYCSCCNQTNALMRSSIMMMPPPQTSGLMHPSCPCTPNHSNRQSQQSSLPAKQPLPVESSSVTSFRRLEQYQQITRYREIRHTSKQQSSNRRPQCPDYDTAMQRICGGLNGKMTGSGNSNSNNATKNNLSSHHRPNNPSHHREDIV